MSNVIAIRRSRMDLRTSALSGDTRFQLALPPDLVGELRSISGVTVEQAEEATPRVQHELAIETIATVVTIVVNIDKVIPACKSIAEQIHRYFSKSKSKRPRVK